VVLDVSRSTLRGVGGGVSFAQLLGLQRCGGVDATIAQGAATRIDVVEPPRHLGDGKVGALSAGSG
jgi:hypothetical protein